MTDQIKNLVGVMIIIVLLAVAYGVVSYVASYAKLVEPSSFRSFSVSAEGDEVAIPDIAEFTFSVVTEGGTDIASLQTENTEKVNTAIVFVKEMGVEHKDIKTQQYNLTPRYQTYSCSRDNGGEPCPPPEIVGYTVTQTVRVKVREFSIVGELLSGVIESGANTVSRLSFTIDDPTKIENVARAEAITKAQSKAKAIAKAGGFSVGRVLSIYESGKPVPTYRDGLGGLGVAESTKSVIPTIEPGSEEVTVRVTITYEIR